MKNKSALLLSGAVVAVGGLFFYTLFLALKADDFGKYDFSYLVLTSSLIRNFPQPELAAEPVFFYRMHEGTAPESFGVRYCSNSAKEEIFAAIDEYLSNGGYKREIRQAGFDDFSYTRAERRFEFSIADDAGNKRCVVARDDEF
ncbi:MAG TPA: hypothetical protein VIL74_17290 [Pyrinomonadaceae bacterium]|jgi:hypothetical protein